MNSKMIGTTADHVKLLPLEIVEQPTGVGRLIVVSGVAALAGVSAVKRAVINKADATSSAIVAAVANKRIIVLDYTLIAAGTVNVTWQTKPAGAAVALSGAMPMVANAGIATTNEHGLIETAVGDALHMLLSAPVQVSGHLSYVEAD